MNSSLVIQYRGASNEAKAVQQHGNKYNLKGKKYE